jgi:hypothetical protein
LPKLPVPEPFKDNPRHEDDLDTDKEYTVTITEHIIPVQKILPFLITIPGYREDVGILWGFVSPNVPIPPIRRKGQTGQAEGL